MKSFLFSLATIFLLTSAATAQKTFTFTREGNVTKIDSSNAKPKAEDANIPRRLVYKGRPADGKRPSPEDFINAVHKTEDGKTLTIAEVESLGKKWGGMVMEFDISKKPLECTITPMAKDEMEKITAKGTIEEQADRFTEKWLNKPFETKIFTDINGRTWDMASLKGKIVVFNFWFTSCKPCIAEMPMLNKIVEQYKNRSDIVFMAPALDKNEVLQKFLTANTFNYTIIPAEGEYQMMKLGITAWPTHMIVDQNGTTRFVKIGYDEGVQTQLTAAIEKLIR